MLVPRRLRACVLLSLLSPLEAAAPAGAARSPALRAGGESTLPMTELAAEEADATMTADSLVQWLRDHAGERILPSDDYLNNNVKLALQARSEILAAAAVDNEMFKTQVLPFQNLDEPVDNFRGALYAKLAPVARDKKTLREVADAVLPFAFAGFGDAYPALEFKGNNTPQVMAPVSETLSKGYASCTGLSIFVTDVLRTVGVPARVVGTSAWNLETGGNHNWVEAWLGDGWHYMDAVPTRKVEWDTAWFTVTNTELAEAGTIHGIYTPVWDKSQADSTYSLTWRDPYVKIPAQDRTGAYKNIEQSKWDPAWEPYRAASEDLR